MDQRIAIPSNVLWISYTAWFLMEMWVMSRDRRRFAGRTADRGSFFGFVLAIPASLIIAFNVAFRHPEWRIVPLQPALSWVGVAMMWAGMAFRLWAIQTLGAFFRTSVVVQEGHQLVTAGPYRWLRHPAYTGVIITMVGLQRIVVLDQAQLGLAAAEQGLEQALEVLVDHLEGGQKALAALGVQLFDALAQARHRARQVGLLQPKALQPGGVLLGLLLGAQVDQAERVPLTLQAA